MVGLEEKIALLKEYFIRRPDVLMVFVFGSYAKGQETSESDFDVAVYFRLDDQCMEWEGEEYYKDEDKIWNDIEKIIGVDTELVVLNRASSTVVSSVLQEGIPVIIRDQSFYLRFFLLISSAAEYFREFTRDFWEIKQRSLSLSDTDKHRLIRITDFLETELSDYPKFAGITQNRYETDTILRRNIERWTENIVNASIDIAKILLASQKQRMPQTYREVIQELSLLGNFSAETSQKLAQFAKLRNILAHEYLDIRFKQIKRFVTESEPLYRELINLVKSFID